jgi:hypothetical protein
MEPMAVLKEHHPGARFVIDERPPIGKRIWMVTQWGNGFAGDYNPEYKVVWWSYLPALTPEQSRRKMALGAAGVDLTTPVSLRGHPPADENTEEADSWSCVRRSASPPSSTTPSQTAD